MYKKTVLLKEDETKIYNKWVSGIAKREASPDVITVDDIVNRYRNSIDYSAPKSLPYPLNLFLDFVGNIFIKSAELRQLLGQAVRYPLFKESSRKIEAVKKLNHKLKSIQEILYSCTEELNILIEKSEVKIK